FEPPLQPVITMPDKIDSTRQPIVRCIEAQARSRKVGWAGAVCRGLWSGKRFTASPAAHCIVGNHVDVLTQEGHRPVRHSKEAAIRMVALEPAAAPGRRRTAARAIKRLLLHGWG